MTDYVKSTNFASKDSLATGNPLKIVKGTEIDTEFNNIATSIATKADLNSPTFIGTPLAPTAALGTNTTQIATMAAIQAAVAATKDALYPVGSIYINATNSTNPATLLGFGTWSAFGAGRVPVGFDAGNSNFNAAEKTGGSADAVVVAHSHTGNTAGAGGFSGSLDSGNGTGDFGTFRGSSGVFSLSGSAPNRPQGTGGGGSYYTANISVGNHTHSFTTDSTGSSGTNANLQPYITVYMWKRTA